MSDRSDRPPFAPGDRVEAGGRDDQVELAGAVGTVDRVAPYGHAWVRLDRPPAGWSPVVLFVATELRPLGGGPAGGVGAG